MANVRIDKSVASITEQLIGRADSRDIKLFNTLAEVLVFAALLGQSNARKKHVVDPRPDPIRLDIFENNHLDSYIYLLAIHDSGGFDLLKDENLDNAILNFEAYAFGGLEIIAEWIEKSGKGLYESILEQMSRVATERSSEVKAAKPQPKIITKKTTKPAQ